MGSCSSTTQSTTDTPSTFNAQFMTDANSNSRVEDNTCDPPSSLNNGPLRPPLGLSSPPLGLSSPPLGLSSPNQSSFKKNNSIHVASGVVSYTIPKNSSCQCTKKTWVESQPGKYIRACGCSSIASTMGATVANSNTAFIQERILANVIEIKESPLKHTVGGKYANSLNNSALPPTGTKFDIPGGSIAQRKAMLGGKFCGGGGMSNNAVRTPVSVPLSLSDSVSVKSTEKKVLTGGGANSAQLLTQLKKGGAAQGGDVKSDVKYKEGFDNSSNRVDKKDINSIAIGKNKDAFSNLFGGGAVKSSKHNITDADRTIVDKMWKGFRFNNKDLGKQVIQSKLRTLNVEESDIEEYIKNLI
jgi:hypothetical protein